MHERSMGPDQRERPGLGEWSMRGAPQGRVPAVAPSDDVKMRRTLRGSDAGSPRAAH